MSYSIQYGQQKQYMSPPKKRVNLLALIGAVLIPLILLTVCFQPSAFHQVKDFLLPWEKQYVQEAFADFNHSVRSGVTISDAIKDLYYQIIHAAQNQ